MIGNIHSFETFGTVDGPGIRFVLFLKGCPLRCAYCHNPDTWTNIGSKQIDSKDILEQVLKYKNYYKDGGLTISGGEPLLQLKFITEVCKLAKENGIHTAIDTSGCTFDNKDIDKYNELIKYVDLFLLDIKHIDNEKCIKLTGKSNENTLEFAKYLNKNNKKTWIRYVLVPGYTNDLSDLENTRSFIDTLSNVEKIELLPYHKLGITKYNNLGVDYKLKDVTVPTNEEIDIAKAYLKIN